jgi:hypothetical protein
LSNGETQGSFSSEGGGGSLDPSPKQLWPWWARALFCCVLVDAVTFVIWLTLHSHLQCSHYKSCFTNHSWLHLLAQEMFITATSLAWILSNHMTHLVVFTI